MMGFSIQEFLVTSVAILFGIYYYISWRLNYWKKKGVPGPSPVPIFGNFPGVFFQQTTIGETINEIYREWKHKPFIGVYKGQDAQLIINDLDLIKTVLIKDFSTFSGRGFIVNEDVDPLTAHLVNIDGPRWKAIRSKLTPIFTTGKLKQMTELMIECSNNFEKYLKIQVEEKIVIDCREVAAKFTTDVVGSCAFGINMNSLSDKDSEFRRMGKKIWESSFSHIMKRIIRETTPWLYRFLKLQINSNEITNFFIDSLNETIAIRKREKIVRHDLIDLFIEIQETEVNNPNVEFTNILLIAQAFIFFAAGFETSSSAISFAMYELAFNPEIQEKVRKEILETLDEHNGQLSYEIVSKMAYLGMVIDETLRKNTPASTLTRQSFCSYTIPGTNITIEKGTFINIPIQSIHLDPHYFPNPEVFEPERFSRAAKAELHSMAYLPFGDGPKNCIGPRFALCKVKLGLIKVLKNFRLKPSKTTVYPYKLDPGCFIITPQGGINLVLEPL